MLLNNPFKPRVSWSMVIILVIIHSGEGQFRVVKIQRPDKYLTNAAVSNLYPLELVSVLSYAPLGQEKFLEGVFYDQGHDNGIPLGTEFHEADYFVLKVIDYGQTLIEFEPKGVSFYVNSEDDIALKVEKVAEENEIESQLHPTRERGLLACQEGCTCKSHGSKIF